MRFLIQRVNKASVSVDGEITGSIGKGFLVLIGIGSGDTEDVANRMVKKMAGLRIFADENGKTNLSIKDIGGELLLVSQFTLYADCKKGNRPSFVKAAGPDMADRLYRYIIDKCSEEFQVVEKGVFGADMKVSLENDGPFTVMLDSGEL